MNIELRQSEIESQGYTIPQFQFLELPQQRWIAAKILRTHTWDNEDIFRAEMIDLAHPNFSQFTILFGH